MARKLTTRTLDALRPDGRHVDILDAVVPGLGLRVTPSGVKTWYVRYRAHGAQRRYTLGRYPVLSLAGARQRARKLLVKVADGEDPAAERQLRRAPDATFASLAREVLDAKGRSTRPRTQRERERICTAELLPAWAARPAAQVTRRDVVQLVERIAERAPVLASRTLSLVNLLYNEGLRRGFPGVEANPAHLLRAPAVENGRARFLSADEIRAVWHALDDESEATRALGRVLVLSAQRVGAACALRWTDVVGDIWCTPAEIFKGKRDHLTPLSPQALSILDELRPLTGDSAYVFPGRDGGPRNSLRTALIALRERAALSAPWTWHNLRRTYRTHSTRALDDDGLGVASHVADAVLGHAENSLGYSRYQGDRERYLLSEKRDALAKWGAFVERVVK